MLRSIAAAGAALLLGTTVACSGSADQAGSDASTQRYCDALESAQQEFGAIDSGNITPANLNRILDRMHDLADQAPAQVADDWQKLNGAFNRLQSGLGDLGLSFEDLSDPRKLSQVDPQELQKFGQTMQQLGGPEFDQAGNAIERHARQVCHLNLGQG